MAEGDGAKNQGQQQSGQTNEAENKSVDQKKLDRAAKERERRRRRRRKKAELMRLQKETLGQGVQPEPEKSKTAAEPEKKKQPTPETKLVRPPEPEEHPMIHKTHSFTGPLIEPEAATTIIPKSEPTPSVVEPAPQPDVKLEPKSDYTFNPEQVAGPEPEQPPTEAHEFNPEPEEAHEAEQPKEVHEFNPEPQSEPEPSRETPVHEPEQPPVAPSEEIVIHDKHEKVRPVVDMHEEQPEEIKPVWNAREALAKEHPEVIQATEKQKASKETSGEQPDETVRDSGGLLEKKSFLKGLGGFFAGVFKGIGTVLRPGRIVGFLVLVLIGGGLYAGYLFKVHEKVYDFVAGFFKTPPPVQVNVDEELLREWGITTAMIFGDNRGSIHDLLAPQLKNSYYFGFLSEPKLPGETGITPAYFYGTGKDVTAQTDRFIAYIADLRALASVYDVNVYRMLDQTTDRQKAMNDYVANLHTIQDNSTAMSAEVKKQVDDVKVSYDSLTPDKTQFEKDFFVALKGLDGLKSDFLLKSFIDVSQKQVALKARFAALQQIAAYYDSSLGKLAIRITAVEKNREALVQGIHVVDIPGANLDIIIKPTS